MRDSYRGLHTATVSRPGESRLLWAERPCRSAREEPSREEGQAAMLPRLPCDYPPKWITRCVRLHILGSVFDSCHEDNTSFVLTTKGSCHRASKARGQDTLAQTWMGTLLRVFRVQVRQQELKPWRRRWSSSLECNPVLCHTVTYRTLPRRPPTMRLIQEFPETTFTTMVCNVFWYFGYFKKKKKRNKLTHYIYFTVSPQLPRGQSPQSESH